MNKWTIADEYSGERLDVFLSGQIKEKTRSAFQKMIQRGEVTVNGKPATVHRFLKTNDVVEWKSVGAGFKPALPDRPTDGQSNLKSNRRAGFKPAPTSEPIIIAETADWLVLDKPAGLLVHPDAKTKTGTLVDWLIAHDPKIARVGEDPERPWIVHRLDREVSGLMVVAKTPMAYEQLKKQFASHQAEKKYLALVHGEVSKDEGEIKFKIARSSSKARMAARPAHEDEGRAAWTHYRILKRFRGATLLEITILSGRTHQIRAHLQALGHPIVGDTLYARKFTTRNIQAPRLMLQSTCLAFQEPKTEERRTFTIEPDPSFEKLVAPFRPSASTSPAF